MSGPYRNAPADFLALTKPRIVAFVLVTVAAGYALAAPAAWLGLWHALLGTALVAAGAGAMNQVAERDVDARMQRTAGRPIPAGRVAVPVAAAFAWAIGALGVVYLAATTEIVTAALAAATFLSYVFVYTPLKRRTALATLVGAVPGALPIVGGWTAAGGSWLDGRAWVLFWILFLWQLPHFLALSWIYRDDYARAGLKMLSVGDADGRSTFAQAALNAAALLPISLAPTLLGMTGAVYFFGAAVLSGWFFWAGVSAARHRSAVDARRLFKASLVYLPGLLALMVADRVV